VLFNYTSKDKRKAGQKVLKPIKEIVSPLVTSFTFPLQRIDKSMPKENLITRTSLSNKRMVLKGSSSNPLTKVSTLGAPPSRRPSSYQK